MAPFLMLTLISIYLLQYTQSQPQQSCYYYGCGFHGASQECQCNSGCQSFGDCCNDFDDLCTGGNFAECPHAPIIKEDRRENKNILRFVSFNIEWLFLDYSHSMGANYCPGTGCNWHNSTAAYIHLHTVAHYLDSFNADIILLQETCDCWTIQQLITAMPDNGAYYRPYLVRGTDTATGQNVALITKIDPLDDLYRSDEYVSYPVAGSNCVESSNSGSQGCSKHFRSRFRVDGLAQDLSIFNVHLLAYPIDASRCRSREGQATVIANMIREDVVSGNLIIVAGDFNDYGNSVCDINCNTPISAVESIIRTASGGQSLVNAANSITQITERYTVWWDCHSDCIVSTQCFGLIDQVLLSQELYAVISDARIDHGFQNECVTNFSDHWPYVITLDLTKSALNVTANIKLYQNDSNDTELYINNNTLHQDVSNNNERYQNMLLIMLFFVFLCCSDLYIFLT